MRRASCPDRHATSIAHSTIVRRPCRVTSRTPRSRHAVGKDRLHGSIPGRGRGATPSLDEDPALGLSHRAKMEILFAVMLGLFLGALDQTIVGPALPTIVTQLSGNDYYVWAVTIYLLTSTISVPFWGKLSDLYGRKPIFMIGIVIFLIGSALSGLSQNMGDAHPLPRHPGRRRRCAVPGRARDHRRPVHARPSAASTRACSVPCSVSRSSPARSSAAA